jgi:hypothetical protein
MPGGHGGPASSDADRFMSGCPHLLRTPLTSSWGHMTGDGRTLAGHAGQASAAVDADRRLAGSGTLGVWMERTASIVCTLAA